MSLADRIASLAPEQRALFEKLVQKQQKATRAPAPPPIPRVSGPRGEGDWPLSLDQERYWFLEQLYPEGAGLNISAATRVSGPLVVPFLAAALDGVIHRHAAWRTTFPILDGRPVQRVAAERAQLVPLLDLSALPAGRRGEEAARRVTADVAAAFDLGRGPLVRSSLVRMSATDHLCLLTVHHLVTDFLSFQIAWGEVAALYAALATGRPGGGVEDLPALPVQYADFAVWQRGWLAGEVLAELTSWWREQLADFPLALELPTDRPRPAAPRLLGSRRQVAVPVERTAALRSLGREAGATLFMSVLAATAALLHRDSGQEKLILGANNANRNRPEIEPVVGCFLTQVPFALDLSGDPTFRELLARVRQSALGAYAHQDLPFGQLVQAIELPRDPSRQPLVQALVQVLDGQPGKVRLAGIELAPVDAYDGRARYDLMLSLFEDPQAGLVGSLEYDADLFDATTVERQIERLLLQIAAAVADPAIRLKALPVLSEAARHQALREWSDTAAPLPGWTAPERFAAQAARTPEALAVVAGGETLTYAALDRRATDLARRLQAIGVGSGSRVALLLDRTVDLPVAIFGVWKAGGAYVPLDVATPVGRLADLLADVADVGPAAVVHRGALPLALAGGMRSLDLAAAPAPREAADRPLPDPPPGQLAYLLYTSGTTGRPKAVMVEHGHLAAVLGAFLDRYGQGPGDRSPHLSRYTFDASLLEIVAPLLAGAATEILTADEILDPAALATALAGATRIVGVPAVLRQVVAAAAGERGRELAAGLRTIAAGGEAIPRELQAELLATFPNAELDIVYGPTEATILCTAERVSRRSPSGRSLLGRPLPGVEVRVVDPRGEPVPLGVPGELWIGGPGVARGYFRRPQLSAERFVERENRRFYRTGDLVRQVPALGGSLEFLGRIDLQVKVRGIRIEPGEIEAALARHPAVREAVVVARPGRGGDRQLVAYVVPEASTAAEPEALRAFLRTLLPEALVPSVFVLLPKLPLQTSGKVDRQALPEPAAAGAVEDDAAAPPRNAREERLAEIWRAVLGRERVGVHDNFFQLGGDSILSIQVVARARQAGLLLTPKLLFENQTIAELAARMTVATASSDAAGAGDEDTVTGEAPLTPVQHRFFATPRRQPERFNQAVLLAVRERLAVAPLAAALERLAAHHDALRLRFVHEEEGWRQLHAPLPPGSGRAVPLLAVDLGALPRAARERALEAAAEELQSGLDIGHMDRGTVFTAALFRRGAASEEGDRLLLTAHHLVVDGVSWRVLVEDLTVAYRQLAAGLPAALPAKTTSWKRWAELLAAHARSPELAAELPAWLALPDTVAPLPVDPIPENGSSIATLTTVSAELGEEETRALLQAVPEVYRTEVNDLLLTALARAFSAWSGDDVLLVDLEGHGREEIFPGVSGGSGIDLSRTVGWFTTLYPVALALPPGGDPRAAIRAVKERLRAVPSHGLGYGLLRYLADPESGERLAALPAPQVSFNYLGQLDSSLPAGGLFTLAPEPVRGAEGPAEDNAVGHPLFAVDSLVLGERLRVSLTYDPRRHLQATAERLAAGFVAELRALVAHCQSPAAGGVTPSDFPLARLDQDALDRLLGEGREQRRVEDLYPLAPLQQGILFHSLYTAGSELYFEQLTARLDGALDLAAFKRAWQRVVERHAALRTTFLWRGVEAPLQLVRRNVELPWTVEDWRGPESVEPAGPAALAERWRDHLAADRARGFDLGNADDIGDIGDIGDPDGPPLLRLGLVRIGEARHLLVWSFHHLLLDGWCFSLLLSEVFALYEAFRQPGGREPFLPRPRPYRDYIAWLGTADREEAERYWRETLRGFTAPTPLPFDHPATPAGLRADDYEEQRIVLPPSQAAGLEALAQRLRVTPNTLVEGAWALLLSRYAQTSDVLFGHVVSGRPAELAGVETMVGLFINTLPVRVRVPEAGQEETAAAWLKRLQENQFELRRHEWTPLARIHALSEVPAGEPLFLSLYVFENYPVDPAVGERLGELRIADVATTERTNYPLTLTAAARGDLTLSLTADRRFEPATARRVLAHLANLIAGIAGIAADPERPPWALPLLSAPERHQLTVEWNDTEAGNPSTLGLHALFAEQAERRPDAVALRAVAGSLSYGELAGRARALARDLLRWGVRRGDLVGLAAERSAELVIALLAIVEAGAAYLPLDPAYPAARLERMLAEATPPLVLASSHLAGRLPAGAARIVPLDVAKTDAGNAGNTGDIGDIHSAAPAGADDLAYVLYTSGSTGTPKGVAVPQGAVARLVRDTDYADFGPDEVSLLMAPLTFDASTFEIWGPLVNGGSLALLPPGEVSLDGLEAALRDFAVTTLWLTAGLFHLVVDERPGALAPLRQLLAGGDVLSPPHVARLRRRLPDLRLVNGYGPTENTTFTTTHRVSAGEEIDEGRSLPIGRPIAHTEAWVLGDDLEPVPIGVPGELYAGGAGLARGYLGRPDFTAASFVPAPGGAGARLYRTGDLVRLLPDGRLEFLGRRDRQVKVRGFRIEPGEIEAALLAHPAVREAAVVAVVAAAREAGQEPRLTAYLVAAHETTEATVATAELRADLAGRLPGYMIPTELVWVRTLPLTSNGKVDRRALAERPRDPVDAAAGERFLAPRTETEERLAAIWRDVLGRERVGIDDNFFELGGDSILSIQVVARARQAGLALTPRQLFEQPTIAALAALPEIALPLATAGEPAEQGAVEGDVPLTPIQRWFFSSDPPEPHHFNQSLLLLPGRPLAPAPLAGALAALVAHHDALRLRFSPGGNGDWKSYHAAADAAEAASPLAVVDLSALPPARRSGALEAGAAALQAGFDLARGPLLRAARFVFPPSDRLLLLAHHLVVDGVSWRVLLEDLRTAYDELAADLAPVLPALPPKTTSFKRWAERLAAAARQPATLAELPYWEGLAAGARPLPSDPDLHLAGLAGSAGIAAVTVALPAATTRALLGEAGAAYRTEVNDLLLTALAQAFAAWTEPLTGETRLRLDLEGHGREEIAGAENGGEHLDLSRTVGWFTALFPVVLDPGSAAATVAARPAMALRAVKETLRAIPRRGLGYGLLRYLAPPETTARLAAIPAPEVAFNYLGQLDGALGGEVGGEAGGEAGWRLAPESAGPDVSPRAGLRHPLEVNAWVLDGRLQAAWTYDPHRFARATVERLARSFAAALERLVAHCLSPEAGGFSPSDFPLARLSQPALDALVGVDAGLDRSIEDLYPLAPLQSGMLFQSLYAPDSEAYFEHVTAVFEGPLDVAAFAAAWQRVLDRHPVLRTGFVWEGLTRPLQVVRRGVELPWTYEDWRDCPNTMERFAAWLAADRARPFDLGRAPLLRAALFRTGEAEHRFVWSFHHLLLDGWSLPLVFGEVFAFYRAARAAAAGSERSAAALPPVRPYRDFLAWLAVQDGTAAERYFRGRLAGFAEPTRLPLDRPLAPAAPAGRNGAPPAEDLSLPAALAAGLSTFARARELTRSTLVHAAWALLLARHGGAPDVVFGSVVSGRPAALPGVESMVGLFINTLPARILVDPAAALDTWLPGVQGDLLELRQHETAALAEIQRASDVPPGVPLFESFVAFENFPIASSAAGADSGLTFSDVTLRDRTGYPLALAALPGATPGDLALRLAYDRRTEATTARRLLGHLANLLAGLAGIGGIADTSAARLADMPLLGAAERQQLLVEWTEGATAAPDEPPLVHAEIALQAARHADAVALLWQGAALTHGELARRSARLGRRLCAAGVTAESVVGLAVERSLDLAVGLLAIWRSGGAFLPLDPALPQERLSFLLADSGARALLTTARLRPELPPFAGPVLDVETADHVAGIAGEEEDAGRPAVAGDLAYLIYTSGTTGTPKAVAVEHGNLARMLAAVRRELGWGEQERMPCLAPFSFDIFLFELLAPLLSGGIAELLPIAPAPDPEAVLAAVARATRFHTVPALMRQVVAAAGREASPGAYAGLRAVYLGGDAVAPDLLADLRTAFPAAEPRVLYGPTEGTILATSFPLRAGLPERPPLGRPLPGVAVRLLGAGAMQEAIQEDTEPVPLGAPGELLLGGIGIARGYLGRPELTAERFVTLRGRRWYRTGDRARFLPDGQLEFLGRADDQVKVRGFRIELGEIETALARDPRVAAAVVLARETPWGDGDRQLVAYVVPRPGLEAETADLAGILAAGLAGELPGYMVPTAFVVLPELPLTAHGKVNRAALPDPSVPGAAGAAGASARTLPRTATEVTLAALWREVLGVAEVYREDHFFALGGHSLLATQLVSRLRATFASDLPLRLVFERPVLGDLAAALVAATAASAPGGSAAPIPHLETGDGIERSEAPLSFAQERLWFIDRLSGTPAYNISLALTLDGELSPAALEAALGETVRRHGSLRTTFALQGDSPVQVVAPPAGLWLLPGVDLSALPAGVGGVGAASAAEIRRLAEEDARRPFDLARGPLLRATLLSASAGSHTLLLSMHHIVSDGWSMGIVVREAMPLYRAALAGRPSPLPPLALQYTDFAVWQRRWLAGEVLAEQLDYWRRTLAGAPADLELPLDRRRPARQSYRGARVSFPIAPEPARALKDLLAGAEATLFMGLLAAFQALLARFTGEDDLVVGSPIANRGRSELAPLVGFFVNTVVFRTRVDGDLSFRRLLDRVREAALGAYAHQDLPFERLVAELAPERSLARSPLFQVMFAVENTPLGNLDLPGLRLTPVAVDSRLAQFDLALTLHELGEGSGLAADFEYSTDLFHPTTVARLGGHFETLLAAALETPDRRLAELPLLSAAERGQLLREWNDTRRDDLPEVPLHRGVEARAAAAPDALAVLAADSGACLTYGELDRRAARLARRLRDRGVGADSRVALDTGRSPDLVVGMLAVLKAGGAYVPVEPGAPPLRVARLLADSGATLLLRAERPGEASDPASERPTPADLPVPADIAGIAGIAPSAAAYVIYTSGSTGRAKGVVVSHRSVSLYARSTAERYRLRPGDRLLQFASLGFDTSVDEIWCPLTAGAALVLRSEEMAGTLPRFTAEVERLGITVLSLPTAFWHELCLGLADGSDAADTADAAVRMTLPPAVRLTVIGGEEAQPQRLADWRAGTRGGGSPLLNAYGPTETTVAAAFASLAAAGGASEPVSLGRPMDGARLHGVDRDLQLVPIGVWGELLIGGMGVARGYLGRPDLTAERFLPDAWGDEPGGRVYRTGDRVRLRGDGELLFGGRLDQQVKIRGFRIEPGEIEAALMDHPRLAAAVVVTRRAGDGDSLVALVAGIVPVPGEAAPSPEALRAFLAERLPAPMIPAAFAVLPELPLTPNGKVDRRRSGEMARLGAIGAMGAERPADAATAPRTTLEVRLAQVWSEVLGMRTVGRDDSFFALGGHSLAATRLVARLAAGLGVTVPLAVVFEAPTLAAMAERIERLVREEAAKSGARGAELPLALWRRRGGESAPLSFAQERLWFVDRLRPGNPAFNMPSPFLLRGRLDLPALARAFRAVRRRQGSLRTTFVTGEGGPVQVIAPAGATGATGATGAAGLPPRVDLDALKAPRRRGEAERLAAEDAARPFDLERGPLFRPLVVRLGATEHLLLLTCHHVISDGWSAGVLLRDLTAYYTGFAGPAGGVGIAGIAGTTALPDLPVQYADYAVWQRERFSGAVLDEQIDYWRRQLAGVSPLDLPTDRPRRAVPTLRGGARAFRLGAAAGAALAGIAREQGATLFMALHAGFAALLALSTGRRDLPIGAPVAQRTRPELEGLIGFFVNTLVLRADLSGDPEPTFPALVARSRQVALGAFAHQDLPFERLVDELGLPRDPYRPPLLRVLFQLQNTPDALDSLDAGRSTGLDLPGLSLAPFDLKTEGAKFDLVVNLSERGGAGAGAAVEGELRYDADLFDGPTIERLSRRFERLLATWAADPGRPLSALSLLGAAERQQLLVEWNAMEESPLAERQCLHRRFEARVDRAPDALALGMGGERLTYGELDRWANRIAWHLLGAGIRSGDRVALSLERSAGMVAAILGVLKAGAAYVPFDPAQPAERLAFAREDSGATLLLTAADLESARAESCRRPAVPVDPGFPAYVIYTSGSTGRPKGVVVSHANVDRLFTVTAPTFGFGPGDTWTLFHSYAFDFSVWEIFGALLHGGRLVVVPYWESRSPADFYRLLAQERITVLNQTPSAFRQLLWAEEAAPADLALRAIIFGGEALNPASLAPWFERHGDAVPRLVNLYGITETTVHVTLRPMRKADLERGSVSGPLGRPLPDLSLYLLDDAGRPQPIGVPGEIYVGGTGGAGLAQGYLGRPDWTALRFLPDPFSSEPGARLYRSGDLARRLPDGDLEYLGRIDHQVKIRGFRIELGEIEAALVAHPGVREAVVLLRDEAPAPPRLVAYVVPAPEEAPDAIDAAALRQHLADRLPEPMLPAAFVLLGALPLTVNGKVDRRALPAPEAVETRPARGSAPPRTALERYLAEQFRAVLGIGPERAIGINDDFFALGGTSISGAIFIHRLQEALGEIVHVVAIFDHPSVAALADYVREQHGGAARRIWGEGVADGAGAAPGGSGIGGSGIGGSGGIGGIGGIGEVVGHGELAEMRRLVVSGHAAFPERVEPEPANPPALFLLSPPRSGSTLLRVMLGAHPRLFAPPELELLSFRTMAERHAAFTGRDRFWLEGLVRAVMEARQVDAAEAERSLGEAERQDWSTHRFYGELMSWLGGRMLVDKTPSYALDPTVLARAESGFAGARYLHLVRHPRATLRSFEEAKMEQIFFRRPHPFSRRQLAELIWTVSHENIRAFLAGVPEERFRTVHFEELVREPDRVLAGLCDFLGLEFRPEMAEPYRPGVARMVDGPHAVSRMLGDVKFLGHGRVDPAAAERWREGEREAGEVPLGPPARELALALGYPLGYPDVAIPGRGVLVTLQQGSPAVSPLFCVHPVGGEVVAYRELALRLGPERPVYGLQSPEPPVEDVAAMSALYLEAVRQVQPAGPYHVVGWSMGGVVAYEMARQLVALGERVETLALLDTLSPLVWTAEPALSDVDLVAAFALDLARLSGVAVPDVDLSALDLEGALTRVLQLGRAAGVLAPGVELAELRRLFERFRANRRALATYPPLPYAGPVTLFRAGNAGDASEIRPDLGWGELVSDLRVAELPGDHYSILHGPGAAALAVAVRSSPA